MRGVLCGGALARWPLALRPGDRGQAAHWPLGRRAACLAITAALSAAFAAPLALGATDYGERIHPGAVDAYPELGPRGRYPVEDWLPYASFHEDAVRFFNDALRGGGPPLIEGLQVARPLGIAAGVLSIACLGGALRALGDPATRRLCGFLLATLVCHVVSSVAAPYFMLPHRYASYGIPALAYLGIPAGGAALAAALLRFRGAAPAGALAATLLCLIAIGGRVHSAAGVRRFIPQEFEVYAFFRGVDVDAVVAGFPTGPVANIPYLSRRSAFLSIETHHAYHEVFAQRMRERSHALIQALYGRSLAPLIRLRDDFGVRFLLVDQANYTGQPPVYFAPFNRVIRRTRARGYEAGFGLPPVSCCHVDHEGDVGRGQASLSQ